ncbi:BolA family transcriptional regulator [Polynucleobacter paludilacus]|uniref:BolA family protein n=1 Tax=Polynucleobacter paludilacus TaxID=1855895 RepID=UPI001BFEBAD2|nr:BolA family protein [Polynucleobacter paludilacus]QWD87811.1 BolA family transcriptional regulator [Polynucleobacter paludilacus]
MNLNQQRIERFRSDLQIAFKLSHLEIQDESHLHAGHAGAASGGGHFRIHIVASEFSGLSAVARHRAVYAALKDHIPAEIHALSIHAFAPHEIAS